MIDLIKRPLWLDALILAGLVTLSCGAGWAVNGWRLNAEIERIKGAHQAEIARNALAATVRLDDARKRNDVIETELNDLRLARAKQDQEKDDEIKRLTTGRRCLSAAAVGVLSRPAGAALGAVPPASSEPVPGTARFATDTDVGLWARTCRSAYESCRADRAGVRKFYEGEQ
jgi:hypothetical protein